MCKSIKMDAFKILVLMILFLVPGMSNAAQNWIKENKVASDVTTSFAEKCPGMNVKKWKKEDSKFIATFFKEGKKFEASFDENGNWMQTESQIKWAELPSAVRKTYYASDFKWLNRNQVEKLQTTKYKEVYLIEGDNLDQESDPYCPYKLWLTPDGKIVKKELGF